MNKVQESHYFNMKATGRLSVRHSGKMLHNNNLILVVARWETNYAAIAFKCCKT
jgi:hypothetical protein